MRPQTTFREVIGGNCFPAQAGRYHLYVLNKPEVMIGSAASRFDGSGRLTDEATRKFLASQLVALRAWTELVGKFSA